MYSVLIPAYEPDVRLVALVSGLQAALPGILIVLVDDGSGPTYAPVFSAGAARGAVVLTHTSNRGKGAALRTGLSYLAEAAPTCGVVTADCDGQHTVADIRHVGEVLDGLEPDARSLVLGCRDFTGRVPLRSRFGNAVTRLLFRAASGVRVTDTQTGLRGLSPATAMWALGIGGDRFEYEFSMLLQARDADVALVPVPIATVYSDGNAGSHFRPIVDSARIYAPLVRFAGSSLLAFAVDTVALLVLQALTGSLLLAVVGARLVSAGVNFLVNHRLVFRQGRGSMGRSGVRYACLAALLLTANYGALTALTDAGLALLPAKILTEVVLFVVSYQLQRQLVFSGSGPARDSWTARRRDAVGGVALPTQP